jgi:hypothetical protein
MFPIITTYITNIFGTLETTGCNPSKTFFWFTPVWYKYIDVSNSTGSCDFAKFTFYNTSTGQFDPSNIFLILLAVLDDLLVIAGVVAVVFVLYGALQFIIGQGEPERIKKAQGTILNALIGLVIAVIAATLVNFIGTQLASN